ncbi:hypothetical protein BABA_13912 [Neobacillus bataviensis LMG 21833]|uniref:Uncharacterized protein n=1 Tax=Neobacillus bataviensis LMG 21833 TaxID=1117379 RepID=K6DFD5_9BACI|nr:MFS transporter [Neobacillus bataviensis]EKN66989.1 hypothetical protein BABA_13912 [Neobacillus bataviensis LMG 21833]
MILTQLTIYGTIWAMILGTIVIGLGQAFVFTTMFIAASSGVEMKQQGIASAIINTGQQIGPAVGLAVIMAIVSAAFTTSGSLEDMGDNLLSKAVCMALIIEAVIALNLKINTVSNAKLTEREKVILSSTADQYFEFDFNVDDKYKDVAVWVEKYESGNLTGVIDRISTGIKNKGTIILSTSKTNEETNQALFTISISSNGGTSTGWSPVTVTKDDIGIDWGINPLDNIPIMDKMVLAGICYSRSNEGTSTLSTDFYSDVDSHMNELKNYDVVYLLRSEFK